MSAEFAIEGNSVTPSGRARQIKSAILAAGNLPTLPLVALEVTRLAENPLTSVPDMVRLIRNDPALTANVLRAANSGYYGMPRRIDSLNMALVVLGMREVSNLVTSLSVLQTFAESPEINSFDMPAFWEHSAGCAEIARVVATRLHLRLHEAEFTAGLLHDIGKIVLDQFFHDEFRQARELETHENISSLEAERQVMGVDHAEIGAWLAETWSLPPAIAEAIRYHHDPQSGGEHRVLAGLIHISDQLAKAIANQGNRADLNAQLTHDPVWELLTASNPDIRRLDIAAFAAELEENIERAKSFTRLAVT